MQKKLFFLILLCVNGALFAQLDRSNRPKGGVAPVINIKESDVFTLPNGVTVILSENHKLPKVSFYLEIGSSSILEGPKTGLGELAGELMLSGTEKRTKDQLDQEIDYIGASLSTDANSISLQCLTKHMNKGLDLMSDVLLHANFPESEFNRVKKRKESDILSAKSQPTSMASKAEARANFPTIHPYGEIATEETIKNITRDDVMQYFKYLFTPKGSYLVVVGDITKEQVTKLFEQYFGTWQGGDKLTMNHGDGFFHDGNRVIFVNKPNAVQSVITVAFPMHIRAGNKDQLALNVLNGIFGGGGFGARLTQNLREDKAYTYGCYSKASVTDEGSYYSISGNFRNEISDSAIAQVLFELDRIKTDLVTEEELTTIKASLAGNFARSLENPLTIARFALNIIKYNLPKDYYQTYLKRLDAITREELLTIAKTYLTATNANIIVVGNENILDKLKRFDSDGAIEKLDALGQVVVERKKATISKDELIEKYLTKATGTENLKKALKKIAKVKSVTRTIEISAPQNPMPLTKKMYFEAPNKEAFTLEIQNNVVQKSVFNGKSGYELNMQTGKSEYKAEEVEAKKKTVGLFEEANLKANNLKYELIGIETVDGIDAYLLSYTDGLKTTMSYYDVVNFKKIKSTVTEGEREETFTYGNFETIEGIDFPKTMAISIDGLTLDGKVLSIEVNKAIDAKIFE
jgi:predicted Zn-dependent peptidase